jgi:hypothetical protein
MVTLRWCHTVCRSTAECDADSAVPYPWRGCATTATQSPSGRTAVANGAPGYAAPGPAEANKTKTTFRFAIKTSVGSVLSQKRTRGARSIRSSTQLAALPDSGWREVPQRSRPSKFFSTASVTVGIRTRHPAGPGAFCRLPLAWMSAPSSSHRVTGGVSQDASDV